MRRLCVALLALLALPLLVSANEKRQGYCQQQASGSRVTACTVTVFVSGTLTKALLFADLLNTPKANPFVADETTGLWSFYATNGHYDVAFSGGSPSISPPYTVTDLLSLDLLSQPLTPGRCLQSDVNGQIVTASGPCGLTSGTVTTTGNPQIGNLAAFTSTTSITNTDLTGDVTTSGSSATTLSNIIPNAHTFTGAITVVGGLSTNSPANLNIGGSMSGTFTGNPTFGGNPTFSGTVTLSSGGATFVPNVAGNVSIGGSLLPFNSIYLGSGANQTVQLFPSGATANRTAMFPDANGIVGINFNSTNGVYQSKRAVAGCTTGSSAGNTCASDITVTWSTAFSDANYSVSCTGNAPTNVPSEPFVVSGTKLAATVHVNYFAITAAAASFASVDCVAVHD